MITFKQYVLKESQISPNEQNPIAIPAKITLGDGNDFKPFDVSDDAYSDKYGKAKDLAPIIRAFKKGATWGMSKDADTGEEKPVRISTKKLFLTGGAVRDHLLGIKPRNYELATNASSDEIRHILSQNNFKELDPDNLDSLKQQYSFMPVKYGKNGYPTSYLVKVNNSEFELDIFQKTPRGFKQQDVEIGTQPEDALSRDYTINGLYLQLSNDDGPNKELFDYFGGIHHLASKKIEPIGDFKQKLESDPTRILRYLRMMSKYGDISNVSDDTRKIILLASPTLKDLDRRTVMDDFNKGIGDNSIQSRKYLQIANNLGLLNILFPNSQLDSSFPKQLMELGDKIMPIAFMLKNDDMQNIGKLGFDRDDIKKVAYLIRINSLNPDITAPELSSLYHNHISAGIPEKNARDYFLKTSGKNNDLINAFFNYAKEPRIKIKIRNELYPNDYQVNPQFVDLIDPVTGSLDYSSAENRRQKMELKLFQNILNGVL